MAISTFLPSFKTALQVLQHSFSTRNYLHATIILFIKEVVIKQAYWKIVIDACLTFGMKQSV